MCGMSQLVIMKIITIDIYAIKQSTHSVKDKYTKKKKKTGNTVLKCYILKWGENKEWGVDEKIR